MIRTEVKRKGVTWVAEHDEKGADLIDDAIVNAIVGGSNESTLIHENCLGGFPTRNEQVAFCKVTRTPA